MTLFILEKSLKSVDCLDPKSMCPRRVRTDVGNLIPNLVFPPRARIDFGNVYLTPTKTLASRPSSP